MSRCLRAILVTAVLTALLTACAAGGGSRGETDPRRTGSAVERTSKNRVADLNTRLGVGYLEQGNVQVALEKLELAISQDPNHAPAHLALGILYQKIGRTEPALKHLKRAVELIPEDGGARNNYGVLLCRVGRYAEADREFRAALEDPFYRTPVVALTNAGACARRAGRLDDAERYLRQALRLAPENPDTLYQMAELSLAQGNALSARGFLQRLEALGELTADALLLGVRVERTLGHMRAAETYAQTLQSRYPDSEQARALELIED